MSAAVDSPYAGRTAQMFPMLTPAQLARLETHGKRVRTVQGQILAEPGQQGLPMWVVIHRPGSFSGEMSTLRGVASMVRMRVREAGLFTSQHSDVILLGSSHSAARCGFSSS